MQIVNMLSAWEWGLLAAVPAAIVALYFLKLRREPLEVPSTYLWTRSIEDLRVNSLWQRMRQSSLLFLQLALIAIVAIALLRPYWEGGRLAGGRYIFLIDNSASMSATDVTPNRLEEAKRRAGQLLDEMNSGDTAMVISFSDQAKVEQSYTENVADLRRALESVKPTNRSTSLDEALRLAAGLANPGQSATGAQDQTFAPPLPADVYIFSDGRFPDVRGFSLGNLRPKFVSIGMPDAANVGIVAFTTGRNENHPEQLQAFVRLENHGAQEAIVKLDLELDGQLIDTRQTKIAANESASEAFALGVVDRGILHIRLTPADLLPQDNEAWTVINPSRRSRVLLVTGGDEPLHKALTVPSAQQWAEVTELKPDALKAADIKKQLASGAFDLAIFDRCRPEEMPRCNTWFIGALPPLKEWSAAAPTVRPQIIDTDRNHPIMQGIELGDVEVLEGTPLTPPAGSTRLIDSNKGTLLAVAPREGFEDAVLGFELLHVDEHGDTLANTNWPIKLSFPVFISNLLQYFGHNQQLATAGSYRTGQQVALRADGPGPLEVRTPAGNRAPLVRSKQQTFNFSQTDELGVYSVYEGGKPTQTFAVNLFDGKESDIRARAEGTLKIGYVDVPVQDRWEPARREVWKVLLLLALGVLLFEWYIYNRRVYL